MTTVTINNPIKVVTKTVGPSGQVYVGKELEGRTVTVVISDPKN